MGRLFPHPDASGAHPSQPVLAHNILAESTEMMRQLLQLKRKKQQLFLKVSKCHVYQGEGLPLNEQNLPLKPVLTTQALTILPNAGVGEAGMGAAIQHCYQRPRLLPLFCQCSVGSAPPCG